MDISAIGYDKDLFVLPFDHRSSFEAGLLGIRGRPADPQEVEQHAAYKRTIYEGLLEALGNGVPTGTAAVLVDQKYGEAILADARKRGIITCTSVKRSGQAEFDFEFGDEFGHRLQEASPTFSKTLVRYNPDGDAVVNVTQRRRLKLLSDHSHSTRYRFMFELLVPATASQLESVGENTHAYETPLRPELTVRAMRKLQEGRLSRMSGSWSGWRTPRLRVLSWHGPALKGGTEGWGHCPGAGRRRGACSRLAGHGCGYRRSYRICRGTNSILAAADGLQGSRAFPCWSGRSHSRDISTVVQAAYRLASTGGGRRMRASR